jgi:N-acetyl sugar amidotransferase
MKNKIQFCTRCLYSNLHPLSLTFDSHGVCSGCKIHEEKNTLDWRFRWEKLKKIVKPYRSKNKKNYDCIVPVTGANDSYFIVHLIKNKLGLNPLLVNYNKYFNTPLGIHNFSNLRIKFDVDSVFQNINPLTVKKITRHTLLELKSIYWPILAGHSVFPVQTAINYKIPLIIWGAHQGMEQVGMFSHKHEVEMTRRYREDHDILGFEENALLNLDNNLTEEDLWQYKYPDDKELNSLGVRGIYLGNFVRWDPASQHQMMVSQYSYKSSNFSRTFDVYDHVDCYNYMDLHDYLKLCKHGYSKVTDHACREIRHKRITRDEGIFLVKKYELKKIEYLNLICNWLKVDKDSINFVIERSKNKQFWKETDVNKFKFQGLSSYLKKNYRKVNTIKLRKKLGKTFKTNSNVNLATKPNYITFGKGWDN